MQFVRKKLQQFKDQNRFRSMKLPAGVDLTSNDYLGLSGCDYLRAAAIEFLQKGGSAGSGGSRLLRGHTQTHAELEAFAAEYFAAPKTLYFSSGFQANTAIFQTLCGRHDVIVFDEYIHASAREGIQNSKAQHIRVAHNDIDSFKAALGRAKAQRKNDGHIWVAVESVYSMDGDVAPLDELYALAQTYDAALVVDDAHATGVLGEDGKGLAYDVYKSQDDVWRRLIVLHTCGKAMGVAGGLVCASGDVIDMLVNAARGFVYSTAPMPLQAYLVQKSLELIASEEGRVRREKLLKISKKAQQFFGGSGTHIVPIIIEDDARAVYVADILQQKGWDIRAVRPPTVPEGTARLRLSLSANLSEDALENFAADMMPLLAERAA